MGKTTWIFSIESRFGRRKKKVSFLIGKKSPSLNLEKKNTHRRGPEAQSTREPQNNAHEREHQRQKGADDDVDRPEDDAEPLLAEAQRPLAVALLLDAVLDGELDALEQWLRPDCFFVVFCFLLYSMGVVSELFMRKRKKKKKKRERETREKETRKKTGGEKKTLTLERRDHVHQDQDVGDEDGPPRPGEPGEDVVGHEDAERVLGGVAEGGVAWFWREGKKKRKFFWSECLSKRERESR